MIDPNLLVIKPVGELENVVNPTSGEILYYDGTGDLKKTPVTQFFQMLNTFAKPIKKTDPPLTVVGWYKPVESGTYPNAGGLTALEGYDTLFYFTGTSVIKAEAKFNNVQISDVFDPTTTTKAQGGKQIYDASKILVDKAFDDPSKYTELYTFGLTSDVVVPPTQNINMIFCNDLKSNIKGYIKKINIHYQGTGSIKFLVLSLNASNRFVVHSDFTVNLVDGQNTVNVNIPIEKGQMLGYYGNIGANVYAKDLTTGNTRYYWAQTEPVHIQTGFIEYGYEVEALVNPNSYTTEKIKEVLNSVAPLSNVLDPLDKKNSQTGFSVANYVGFNKELFHTDLKFDRNYYKTYAKIFSETSFKISGINSFGNMNFLKLTGGSLNLDNNFVPQKGSDSYIPSKTNIISMWPEYGKIRYFIENFDLEPFNFDATTITYQDFTNKSPNAELSSFSADYGNSFQGKLSFFKINPQGTMLITTGLASTFNDTIYINKGDLKNYKVNMYMAFASQFIVSPNDANGTTYSDYIRFIKGTPNTTVVHTTPSGNVNTTTNLVPAVSSSGYLWEFYVRGNTINIYINGGLAYTGTTDQLGNFFSIGFPTAGNVINSIRIDAL